MYSSHAQSRARCWLRCQVPMRAVLSRWLARRLTAVVSDVGGGRDPGVPGDAVEHGLEVVNAVGDSLLRRSHCSCRDDTVWTQVLGWRVVVMRPFGVSQVGLVGREAGLDI